MPVTWEIDVRLINQTDPWRTHAVAAGLSNGEFPALGEALSGRVL